MDVESFDVVKNGLMFCLIGSDKPIIESLQPNLVNQEDALKNQAPRPIRERINKL
jgi:hypothetical protein